MSALEVATSKACAAVEQLKLLCFPFAGVGASLFAPWMHALGPQIEVRPVQPPGRENRWAEPAFTRMVPLVNALVHELKPELGAPFALFGHSMGAFVAFEFARQLRREGGPLPKRLIVSAARAPQIPDPDEPLHRKADADLLSEIRRLNGVPEALLNQPDMLKLLVPVLRADLAVCETYTYQPEPPLNCALSAYGGTHDIRVPRHFLTGWRDHTTAEFNIRIFPGDHFFLQTAKKPLFRIISEELETKKTAMTSILANLRSQAQETLAAVWQEVLGVPSISLDDNIFDLGGNSLHVIQALGFLRDRLNAQLTALDLFQHPTIRSLVQFLYPDPAPERAGHTASDRAARQWKALESKRNSINGRRNNHV